MVHCITLTKWKLRLSLTTENTGYCECKFHSITAKAPLGVLFYVVLDQAKLGMPRFFWFSLNTRHGLGLIFLASSSFLLLFVHTTREEFHSENASNDKTQRPRVISDLCLRKTRSGKSRDYRDVIVLKNLRFRNVFSVPPDNEKPAFSSELNSVFENLSFRDGLLWTESLIVEIKFGRCLIGRHYVFRDCCCCFFFVFSLGIICVRKSNAAVQHQGKKGRTFRSKRLVKAIPRWSFYCRGT